jgi:restriction system protein
MLSQQYKTDIGPIDILAKDKKTNSYVVIELKKNQTSDDTLGQIARYMGWIKETKKDPNVKGIIIAGSYDKKLDYALKMMKNVEVFLYEVNFRLNEFKVN